MRMQTSWIRTPALMWDSSTTCTLNLSVFAILMNIYRAAWWKKERGSAGCIGVLRWKRVCCVLKRHLRACWSRSACVGDPGCEQRLTVDVGKMCCYGVAAGAVGTEAGHAFGR
jgi:hypothetical protein